MIVLMILFGLFSGCLGLVVDAGTRSWRWTVVCAISGALLAIPVSIQFKAWRFEVYQEREAWVKNIQAANCKRTGYISGRSTPYPIWTCPDGQAYIEP